MCDRATDREPQPAGPHTPRLTAVQVLELSGTEYTVSAFPVSKEKSGIKSYQNGPGKLEKNHTKLRE